MAVTEEDYRQKIAELEARVEDLNDFIENGSIPLHWVNEKGIITWANQAELDALGYTKEEYIGQPIAQFHADQKVIDDILKRLKSNETLTNYPSTLKCKSGELKHVIINSNVRRKDGKFINTRCFTRDISDMVREGQKRENLLKELEQKNKEIAESEKRLEIEVEKRTGELVKVNTMLNRRNEELKLSNSELQAFTYMASHDLREPLRKILTYSALTRKELGDQCSKKADDFLTKISKAATRMSKLMGSLLDYAQLTNLALAKAETDLNEILNDVKQQLKEQVSEAGATIHSAQLPTLQLIPFQFQQLFTNLISNSLKYAKKEEPLTITIAAEKIPAGQVKNKNLDKAKPYWLIRFSDNGIGFDQADAEYIFGLFKRLHSKDDYEGTGIGLGICKRIVENHGGVIRAKGEEGKGAEFSIYLPVEA